MDEEDKWILEKFKILEEEYGKDQDFRKFEIINEVKNILKVNLEKIEEKKKTDKRYICDKCEYKWESKKKFGEPSICPNCKCKFFTKYSSTDQWKREQNNFGIIEECLNKL